MTDLEQELRRTLADPPVALPEVAEPLRGLDRRVVRARQRRGAAAVMSVVAVLAAGVSGATALTDRSAAPGASSPVTADGPAAAADGVQPPPEVVAAARAALSNVVGATQAGPARWVATGPGQYLVQIRLTGAASCRVCQYRAGGPDAARGVVLEVRVPSALAGAAAPVPPRTTNDRAAPQHDAVVPGWTLLQRGSDLSRYGAVHEFILAQ